MTTEQSFHDFYDLIDDLAIEFVKSMVVVTNLSKLGLDQRSASKVYVNRDCIAVRKGENDRLLQYYGGFEYVDKSSRKEVGDYVFYVDTDSRVEGHLNIFYENNS